MPKDLIIVSSRTAVERVLAKVLCLPSADWRDYLVSFIMVSCPRVGVMLFQCVAMWKCELMEYLAKELLDARSSGLVESRKRRKSE